MTEITAQFALKSTIAEIILGRKIQGSGKAVLDDMQLVLAHEEAEKVDTILSVSLRLVFRFKDGSVLRHRLTCAPE